ncbi:hypothetical protein KA977_11750, partial [Candidatus Dependentiae bacterium]|nr:hypothetical protein [Candidatus Dependentiae bacterium]
MKYFEILLFILLVIFNSGLSGYELKAVCDKSAEAGKPVKLQIFIVDNTGTLVSDENAEINLNGKLLIKTTGDNSKLNINEVSKSDFKKGIIELNMEYKGAGDVQFIVIDRETGFITRSNTVTYFPSSEITYKINRINQGLIKAGEKFDIRISAFDKFGNKIESHKKFVKTVAEDYTLTAKLKGMQESIDADILKVRNESSGILLTLKVNYAGECDIEIADKQGILYDSVTVDVIPDKPVKLEISSETAVKADGILNFEINITDNFGNIININSGIMKFSLSDIKNPAIAYKTEYQDKSYVADKIRMIRAGNYKIEAVYENTKQNLILSGSKKITVTSGDASIISFGFTSIDKNNYCLNPVFKFFDNNKNSITEYKSNINIDVDGIQYLIENEILNKSKILLESKFINKIGISKSSDTNRFNNLICVRTGTSEYKLFLCVSRKDELRGTISADRKSLIIKLNDYKVKTENFKKIFIDEKLNNCY